MSKLSIHKAAQNSQLSLVAALVEEDADAVYAVDDDGRTPLHWAAFAGAADIAAYLLEHCGESKERKKDYIDKKDASGWTALHIAASAGQESVVRELLAADADPNATNDKGLTPLHYAASKTHIDIGRLLIDRGANINAKDKASQFPLHRAATVGSTGFVALLLKPKEGSSKARLNGGDRFGNTPLHLAMESGHAEVAVMLIEAGADRDRTNSEQEMPEQMQGVGGQEQRRVLEYVREKCGPSPTP